MSSETCFVHHKMESVLHNAYNAENSELFMYILSLVNVVKMVYRFKFAQDNPNVMVKAVLFEYSQYTMFGRSYQSLHALMGEYGLPYIQELFPHCVVYRRRKVIYSTDGTSALSPTLWQVLTVWNHPDSMPALVPIPSDNAVPSTPPRRPGAATVPNAPARRTGATTGAHYTYMDCDLLNPNYVNSYIDNAYNNIRSNIPR